jgi:benzodiazapine receptor
METRSNQWLALAGYLAACFSVSAIAGFATVQAIPTWYANISKPSFTPPNQVFGPVWTILYALMGIAAWLIWRMPDSPDRSRALILFWVQLLLNFAWSWIFFHQHLIFAAALEIVVLWIAILFMTIAYWRVYPPAGWMMLPYLCWVSFASILNWGIWHANLPK